MVRAECISKSFGKEKVLDNVSFTADTGSTVCIVGENGSGKSTLLSIMAGVLKPDSGLVLYGERSLPPKKASIGYVSQRDTLFADLTVKDNLAFWASAAGYKLSSPQVKAWIDIFNISEFLDKRVRVLSGGMRRRVALCTSLIHDPDYILLDEPFSGLDITHKQEICQHLKKVEEQGKTVIYTTHNVDEIHLLAQQLYIIKNKALTRLPLEGSYDKLSLLIAKQLKGEGDHGK